MDEDKHSILRHSLFNGFAGAVLGALALFAAPYLAPNLEHPVWRAEITGLVDQIRALREEIESRDATVVELQKQLAAVRATGVSAIPRPNPQVDQPSSRETTPPPSQGTASRLAPASARAERTESPALI